MTDETTDHSKKLTAVLLEYPTCSVLIPHADIWRTALRLLVEEHPYVIAGLVGGPSVCPEFSYQGKHEAVIRKTVEDWNKAITPMFINGMSVLFYITDPTGCTVVDAWLHTGMQPNEVISYGRGADPEHKEVSLSFFSQSACNLNSPQYVKLLATRILDATNAGKQTQPATS